MKLQEKDLNNSKFSVIKTPVKNIKGTIKKVYRPLEKEAARYERITDQIRGEDNWTNEEYRVAYGFVAAFELATKDYERRNK